MFRQYDGLLVDCIMYRALKQTGMNALRVYGKV